MQNLRDQLGLGEQRKDNPIYISDQKVIKEAQEELEDARQNQREHSADDATAVADAKRQILDAQTDLAKAENMVSLKKRLLSHLENSEQGRAEAAANSIETDNQARAQQLDNTTRLQKLPGEISQATAKEAIEEHTRQVIDLLNAHGGKLNESLARLATEAGKKQKETLDMVESIIAGQSTFASRIAELEAQIKATQNNHTSG